MLQLLLSGIQSQSRNYLTFMNRENASFFHTCIWTILLVHYCQSGGKQQSNLGQINHGAQNFFHWGVELRKNGAICLAQPWNEIQRAGQFAWTMPGFLSWNKTKTIWSEPAVYFVKLSNVRGVNSDFFALHTRWLFHKDCQWPKKVCSETFDDWLEAWEKPRNTFFQVTEELCPQVEPITLGLHKHFCYGAKFTNPTMKLWRPGVPFAEGPHPVARTAAHSPSDPPPICPGVTKIFSTPPKMAQKCIDFSNTFPLEKNRRPDPKNCKKYEIILYFF